MNPVIAMMVAALFPDAVEVHFVPWDRVRVPLWSVEDLAEAVRDKGSFSKPVQMDVEEIRLEPITEEGDVFAGMSEKTHIVFLKIAGV